MNVLILTPEYRGFGGGIMTYYRHLAPALARAGCSVRVIEGSGFGAFDSARPEVIEDVQVQGLEASLVRRWIERFRHLGATPILRRMVAAAWAAWEQATENFTPNVVETTDFGLLSFPALLTPQIPTILQHHGSYGQIQLHDPDVGLTVDAALALALEGAALTVAAAPQTCADANAAFWMRQAGRAPSTLLPAWQGEPELQASVKVENRIAVFGRIQNWKGPRVLCEALSILAGTPPVIWHGRDVAVSGVSTNETLRNEYPHVWGERVQANASVSPTTVANLQASAKLNLVPSTWDVFNFTVIEAMHSGRPVVCSNGAGASELIEDGTTGFVYEGTSSSALASTLDRALRCPEPALTQMGQRARERIRELLNPDKIARQRILEYREAIDAALGRPIFPEWIQKIAKPCGSSIPDLAFLDHQPASALASSLSRRIMNKGRFRL
ncbi:MAG: glycosyltransferase [Hyphomonadaceae bacterium]|nr:glycosyltransferase [Hyphomonadaceae bacterium]MBY0565125.1 glycosyltransferase [Hyphomonadaceae bacterium]